MIALSAAAVLFTWAFLALFVPVERASVIEEGLSQGERLPSPVRGPSGLAFDSARGRLFVVGDRGEVAELGRDGDVRSRRKLRGDLEGVAVIPTGHLLILDETAGELFLYHYDRAREEKRWTLDTEGLLGRAPAPISKDGFEGLAFVAPSNGTPSGRLLLVHQHGPTAVVVVAFDPSQAPGRLGADSVLARWSVEGYRNAKAVTYVPSLQLFLLVSDAPDRLILFSPQGEAMGALPLAGRHPEGVCLDDQGTLWVAYDPSRRIGRFPNALDVLRSSGRRD